MTTKTKGKRQHPRVQTFNTEPSLTKQSFKNETNINNLVNQYIKTGEHTFVNKQSPQYGYVSSNTFMESLEVVDKAQTMFNALPSKLRNRFANDPAEFLEFASDPSNNAEMAEMGLLSEEATAEHLPGDPEPPEEPQHPKTPLATPTPTPNGDSE